MAAIPTTNMRTISVVPSDITMYYARIFPPIAITLSIIATLVFIGRIWSRSRPHYHMQIEDYIIVVAWILIEVDVILLLLAVPMAFGRDPSKFTLQDSSNAVRYALIGQPIWAWAMASIKTSVALMLLRLEQEVSWRRFLWIMIAIQLVLALYNTVTILLQCVPLKAIWDLMGNTNAKCWTAKAFRINTICTSVITIATDLIFALLPISFLRKVRRPRRERITLGILMGLGVFTCVASILKMISTLAFGTAEDPYSAGVQIGMWACVEELVGFIAACIPCLRSLFQRVLEHFHLVTTENSQERRSYAQVHNSRGNLKSKSKKSGGTSAGQAIRMKSFRGSDEDEENILGTGESSKDGAIWCTREISLKDEMNVQASSAGPIIGVPEPSWSDSSANRSHRRSNEDPK